MWSALPLAALLGFLTRVWTRWENVSSPLEVYGYEKSVHSLTHVYFTLCACTCTYMHMYVSVYICIRCTLCMSRPHVKPHVPYGCTGLWLFPLPTVGSGAALAGCRLAVLLAL